MVELRQKRKNERQNLIERLLFKAREYEEKELGETDEKIFEFELMQVLLEYLKRRRINANQKKTESIAGAFFWGCLFVEITRFSRGQEETEWLVAELLRKLFRSVHSSFLKELRKLEELNPYHIFGAPSAITRMSIDR